jgi:hypothetical protein
MKNSMKNTKMQFKNIKLINNNCSNKFRKMLSNNKLNSNNNNNLNIINSKVNNNSNKFKN